MYTKETNFGGSTPKKIRTPTKKLHSPREVVLGRKRKISSPFTASKSNKININMEIKNFNVYGPSHMQHSTFNEHEQSKIKKKKLHKKTISALYPNEKVPHETEKKK